MYFLCKFEAHWTILSQRISNTNLGYFYIRHRMFRSHIVDKDYDNETWDDERKQPYIFIISSPA